MSQSVGLRTELTYLDFNSISDTTRSVILKVENAPELPGGLIEIQITGPHPPSFVLFRSEVGPENQHF